MLARFCPYCKTVRPSSPHAQRHPERCLRNEGDEHQHEEHDRVAGAAIWAPPINWTRGALAGSDQAGSGAASMTSRSAVSLLPLVSGPRSTEITTMTRKNIVLNIIGMAKPMFICTAK
jgi:hypothetical protein